MKRRDVYCIYGQFKQVVHMSNDRFDEDPLDQNSLNI